MNREILSLSLMHASGVAVTLTGVSSADDINNRPLLRVERLDVVMPRHVGPVLCQHLAAIRVDLDLPAALHARSLKAKVHAAYPSE
jgi:hypothetical protein